MRTHALVLMGLDSPEPGFKSLYIACRLCSQPLPTTQANNLRREKFFRCADKNLWKQVSNFWEQNTKYKRYVFKQRYWGCATKMIPIFTPLVNEWPLFKTFLIAYLHKTISQHFSNFNINFATKKVLLPGEPPRSNCNKIV